MTIKEFIESKDFYRVEISKLEGFGEIYIELEDLIKEIVVIKLQEQKQICADEADYIVINRTQVVVDKEKILNAPEPKI